MGLGRIAFMTVLAGGAVATAAPGAVADPRLELGLAFGHQVVIATPGSSCLSGRTGGRGADGRCADAAYPLPTAGRLTLAPRKQLRMRAGATPLTVHVEFLSEPFATDPSVFEVDAVRVARDPHRFRITLPRRLACAKVADIVVTYADGSADFWAAVATPHCVRVVPDE